MWKPCEEALDKDKPGLVVMYGNSKKKYRPLDRDILVLGRGASCDLGLVSPDVAPVHCVIVRQPQGWVLRDCSGRA
ncbi:MAG: FHA domain-containing protein, partial [Gemmataceae bacterium]